MAGVIDRKVPLANFGRALTKSDENRHAIVVLPPGWGGKLVQARQRRWLSRGTVSFTPPLDEMLNRVLPLIGHEPQASGLAALRFWGQHNERVATWMAGADPVYLETMRSNLRLHALSTDELDAQEIRSIFDGLQQTLGDDRNIAFTSMELCGYVRGDDEIETAAVSAQIADGAVADEFMPPAIASRGYHRLLSEIQMYLHPHDVNVRRESAGKRPVNCLWIWGGGRAPEKTVRPIPPLFCRDPLFSGYWQSCTGLVETWDGNLARCLDLCSREFVAVMPDAAAAAGGQIFAECLKTLRGLLAKRHLQSATLLFHDGLSVHLGKYDWLKFWRRDAQGFTQVPQHE